MVIKAAVFDVDGMILDTKEFIFQSYEFTLAKHGHAVPSRAEIAKQIGRPLSDCYAEFAPDGTFVILRKTHDEFQARNMHLISKYDGLVEMLEELKADGVKLGAFSSRKGNLIPSLEKTGVRHYFDVVVQGGDVENHKPHPEGLHKALKAMAVKPEYSAMLGDAVVDIKAGKAGGAAITVGITHGFGTTEDLIAAKPDFIVNDLSSIPPILLNRHNLS